MYEIKLKIATKSPKKLFQYFLAEDRELLNKRATMSVKKQKKFVEIDIKARDAVALRAISNSINRALVVWEEISKIRNMEL